MTRPTPTPETVRSTDPRADRGAAALIARYIQELANPAQAWPERRAQA